MADKLPRAHVWRTYRYTDNQALLAAITLKSSEAFHCTEVDVLLAVDVPERSALSAVRAALLFAITDAVKTGGSLAVQFTKKFTGGVPEAVRKLAADAGVQLAYASRGAIAPEESRALYLALTPFSSAARARLQGLAEQKRLSTEHICYLVHHGVSATRGSGCAFGGGVPPRLRAWPRLRLPSSGCFTNVPSCMPARRYWRAYSTEPWRAMRPTRTAAKIPFLRTWVRCRCSRLRISASCIAGQATYIARLAARSAGSGMDITCGTAARRFASPASGLPRSAALGRGLKPCSTHACILSSSDCRCG